MCWIFIFTGEFKTLVRFKRMLVGGVFWYKQTFELLMPKFLFAQLWPGQTQRWCSTPKPWSSEIKTNDLVSRAGIFYHIPSSSTRRLLTCPQIQPVCVHTVRQDINPETQALSTGWILFLLKQQELFKNRQAVSKMEGLELYPHSCVEKKSREVNTAMRHH